MKRIGKLYVKITAITSEIGEDHVGAYAAQAAYFFMLSLIPIILLLLTLIRYTPVTKADVMTAVIQVFPRSVDGLVTSVVNQVYNQSMSIIPITVIVALWSAGKGVLAMTYGLNCIYDCRETRNYLFLRIRATLYTVMFLLMIILLLVLSVFGNSLSTVIIGYVPLVRPVLEWILEVQIYVSPVILMIFMLLIYKFVPNKKNTLVEELPGAVLATLGWLLVSLFFSVYVDIFQGFSNMYGSMTTIVLIMLWMYFCMYCILLGAEFNVMFGNKLVEKRTKENIDDGKEHVDGKKERNEI